MLELLGTETIDFFYQAVHYGHCSELPAVVEKSIAMERPQQHGMVLNNMQSLSPGTELSIIFKVSQKIISRKTTTSNPSLQY